MYTVSAFVLVLTCKIEPSRFLHLECLEGMAKHIV